VFFAEFSRRADYICMCAPLKRVLLNALESFLVCPENPFLHWVDFIWLWPSVCVSHNDFLFNLALVRIARLQFFRVPVNTQFLANTNTHTLVLYVGV